MTVSLGMSTYLEKANAALVPGIAFGDDKCVRLSFAVADNVLEDAMQRMTASIKDMISRK